MDKKGLIPQSDDPFKGDFDLKLLRKTIKELGPEKVAFVRVEAGTNLIGGLRWTYEPKVLRFFFGRMEEIGYWQEDLVKKFREDFGDSL